MTKNGLVKLSNTIDVQGWPLTVIEDEPRVAVTRLGERVGYKDRPGQRARELVKKLEKDGELCGVAYARESRGQVTGFGERMVEVDEPYLTEVQAVIFVMHVRTELAKPLRNEIARVFVEARAMRRQQPAPDVAAALMAMTAIIERMDQRIDRLESPSHGLAGNLGAAEIKTELGTCVDLALTIFSRDERKYHRRKILGRLTTELRSAIEYSGAGATWAGMPASKYEQALAHLRKMKAREWQHARDNASQQQLSLSLVRE